MSTAAHQTGRSRGFTLVEMSIVLVIIGLIIGGILKGQEIIASAREKAVVNEINAVRSAANTYFDRYRALPGDDPNAQTRVSASLQPGNGDGIVGAAATTTVPALGTTAENGGENYQFFDALITSGLLNGGTPDSTVGPGLAFGTSSLPSAPLTGSGLEVQYGEHTGIGAGGGTDVTQLWVKIVKHPAVPAIAIAAHTLADIDVVTDDGAPDTGGVRGSTDLATCATGGGAPGSTYALQDQPGCFGFFAVLQ